ncbi:MAG TPA: mechanosensitive ion channel family protein [Solimonas sp.]|nr:mechanosensitive ion channel family protein [Solimonas sp.]
MNWKFIDAGLPGGTLQGYLVALGISVALTLTVMLLKPMLARRLERLAGHTRTRLDDALLKALNATRLWLIAVLALSLGTQYLQLSDKAEMVVRGAATVAGFLQLGLWVGAVLKHLLTHSRNPALAAQSAAAPGIGAMGMLVELLAWTVIALLALDNLGINITALVAGLGIGGIALALAAQNILGDLFASLSIVVDKPFVVGDFIIVDNYMGTVENIGLKTTRLRSLDGEQIIAGNADLLKTRLRNFKRMYERRVLFAFKLSLDTPVEKIEKVPALVRQIVEAQKKVRFERAHFQKFGDTSLDFEVVYWVLDPEYKAYMDIQQTINLGLLRTLAREKLELATAAKPPMLMVDSSTPAPADKLRAPKPRDEARGTSARRAEAA